MICYCGCIRRSFRPDFRGVFVKSEDEQDFRQQIYRDASSKLGGAKLNPHNQAAHLLRGFADGGS